MARKAQGGRGGGRGDRLDAVLLLALVALCAAVLAGFAWTRPTQVAETISYSQLGTLSYSGTTSPTSVYGPSGLKTGEPIYFDQVSTLKFTYDYSVQSASTTSLKGSEQLMATIDDGQGITRTVPLQPVTSFKGDKFSATGTVSPQTLQSIVSSFSHMSGSQSSIGAFTLTVHPKVKLDGSLGAAHLETSFDPPTAFSFHAGVLSPAASRSSTSRSSKTQPATTPAIPPSTQSGSLPLPGGQRATFLGLAVLDVRIGSLALLVGALVAGTLLGLPLIWEATSEDERVRIGRRYGSALVDVEALPDAPGLAVDLSSFDGLRQVARRLECPILRRTEAGADVYAVVDNGTLYRYSQTPRPKSTRTSNASRQGASAPRTVTVTNAGGRP